MASNVTDARIALLTARIAALESASFGNDNANTWWLLSNGILCVRAHAARAAETCAHARPPPAPRRVFFMQCGFGMLEAGSVTARATTNILLKNLLDASTSAVVWYSLGYGLAFEGNNPFIGVAGPPSESGTSTALFFSAKMLEEDAAGFRTRNSASGYDWAFWWFQFVSGAPTPRATRARRARAAPHARTPTPAASTPLFSHAPAADRLLLHVCAPNRPLRRRRRRLCRGPWLSARS